MTTKSTRRRSEVVGTIGAVGGRRRMLRRQGGRHQARVRQVRVQQGGARRHALARLVPQHALEQARGVWGVRRSPSRRRQKQAGLAARPARKGGAVVGQQARSGPHVLAGRTQGAEHSEQLIDLAVARK